ncbi:S1 family peptidase [Actinocorallia sp. API 0066]|uniref:trypsin-like peptidase domain-containing protein n=1 Tax=Actinocorallia sp. API 0066 TaxID=2896846 RepID=UPI001E3DAD4F|nr:trypsin-like peptidase domain-containing protein [Actinocorallia sp. API 0066]MCD0452827.1 S1 family peptidase [Actinocorallia sp. API 0066]
MKRSMFRTLGLAVLTAVALASPAQPAQADDRVTLGGGSGIYVKVIADERGYRIGICTVTAVGTDDFGNLVALTNAHCYTEDDGTKLVGDKVYYDPTPAGTFFAPAPEPGMPELEAAVAAGPIGEVTYVSDSNHLFGGGPHGMDYAVIKLDPTKVKLTNTVTSPSGTLTINSLGNPPGNGARLCKQGHRTGLTCGFKTGTHSIWFVTTILTNGGDSGSPAVHGTTLVGNSFGAFHHTPIHNILNDINTRNAPGKNFTLHPTP